jgi:hypothetical protein
MLLEHLHPFTNMFYLFNILFRAPITMLHFVHHLNELLTQ